MRRDLYRSLVAAAGALLCLSGALAAQVGHDPAGSPYRTLRYSQFIGLTGGLFNGNGGAIGVAPHHGATLGLRFDFFSAGTLSLGFAATYANLERKLVDPTKPIATAVSGPIDQPAGITELIVQFNATGGKTWHRIAPYLSGAVGLVLAGNTPQDSTGFRFRTRFALTPGIGARVFLSDRLFLRLEARTSFWSVKYPDSFRNVPSSDPTQPPVLASPAKEWLANGWYTIGVAYAFSRPF